jgi:hypothetical protein
VHLNPISVKFDFLDPSLAGSFFYRGGQSRLDETGAGRLGADRHWFLALDSHRSYEPNRKRKLDVWYRPSCRSTKSCKQNGTSRICRPVVTQLVRDIGRNVLRPTLGGIETDNTKGIFILALEKIAGYRFEVGHSTFGFRPIPFWPRSSNTR